MNATTWTGRRVRARTAKAGRSLLTLLLRRTGQGDREAFMLLFDATVAPLTAIARRRARGPEPVEQTLERLYLLLWSAAPRYRSQDDPVAWIDTHLGRVLSDSRETPADRDRP